MTRPTPVLVLATALALLGVAGTAVAPCDPDKDHSEGCLAPAEDHTANTPVGPTVHLIVGTGYQAIDRGCDIGDAPSGVPSPCDTVETVERVLCGPGSHCTEDLP
jgi:hypothetical protein